MLDDLDKERTDGVIVERDEQVELTDSEKLTKMMINSAQILKENKKQTSALNFIKTVIIIGIVLSVIATLMRSCGAYPFIY
jgi:hypothetical protein